MHLEYVCVVIINFILISESYYLNRTRCMTSYCLSVYGSNHTLSWNESFEACKNQDQDLLSIESIKIQGDVDELLRDLSLDSAALLWIAGRGSEGQTWTYLNGTKFIKTPTDPETQANCLRVKLCKKKNPEYITDNCDEKNGEQGLLCQSNLDLQAAKPCPGSWQQFGDKCYTTTPYSGKNSNKIDWYQGQTYCKDLNDTGASIAYSYIDDYTLKNGIRSLVDNSSDCVHLWLGVRRPVWHWHSTGGKDSRDELPINYFKWADQSPIGISRDSCICIDHKNSNKWMTQHCYDNTVRNFICIKRNQSAVRQRKEDFNLIYLVPIALGVLLIVVIIVVSIIVVHKKSQLKDKHVYVNDGVSPSTSLPSTQIDNQYAEIITGDGSSAAEAGSISSYAEIATVDPAEERTQRKPQKERVKGLKLKLKVGKNSADSRDTSSRGSPIRYIEAPSGELYAVSSKSKATRSQGEEKPRMMYRKGPAGDLYALPTK